MNGRTPKKNRKILRVSLLALATSLASLTTTTWADTTADGQPEFQKRLYLGIGLGASTLRPNPREPDILAVGDDSDYGFHLNLGYDINRWFSGEFYLAYLGEADMDRIDTGFEQVALDSIDYSIVDIAVLGYLFNSRSGLAGTDSTDGAFCREALSLYGRLGLGFMRNENKNSIITHDRNFRQHVTVGAGIEYGFRNGVGIRGEWTGFDSDARYLNLSLVKRFGDSGCQQSYRKTVVDDGKETGTATGTGTPAIAPIIPIVPTITKPEIKTPKVTTPARIEVPIILFDFDISTPDADSVNRLSEFAEQIKTIPGTLQLTGHTDWTGSDGYNEQLSKRRVLAVSQLLIASGIAESRIRTEFRGEKDPASSNSTKPGRAQNRRVNIVFTED